MIIPYAHKKLRDDKVLEIRDACMSSLAERNRLYDLRRRYFLWGTDNMNADLIVRYNRLAAHLDLVASFLYAADHARYSLSVGENQEDILVDQAKMLQEKWNQEFRDSGLAYTASDAILWALIMDTYIIKMGWSNERKRLTGLMVDPSEFGVYDETVTEIDDQEAFCHKYRLPWDNAVLRLLRAGLKDRISELGVSAGMSVSDYPPIFQALMISTTGGANITGNIAGMAPANFTAVATYEAKRDENAVEFTELWVWDDITEDYRTFIIADPDIILSDSRETVAKMGDRDEFGNNYNSQSNVFLEGEHPFVPFVPFKLPKYFWGMAHCDRLMPLQRWTNERLDQISEVLESQVDPAKVFSGFMGLSDEKAAALGGPGTWVVDSLPQAKVETKPMAMPEDLFAEFKEIGHIFLEASGLTETVTGQGQGSKTKGQTKQMATTGSSRIRKVAVSLEEPLVKIGDLGTKLMMKNDDERLRSPKGDMMYGAQFAADKWNMRIAGHSHSPLFADESRELAALLLKARAIDREMFIRMLNPPGAESMLTDLKKMMLQEAKQAQARAQQQELRGGGRARAA
jgi:hypothetical protein